MRWRPFTAKIAGVMKKSDVVAFFDRLAAGIDIPRSELEYKNPYTLLVAVVLSAQATDAGVNKATGPLFKVADTPEKMLSLGEARLKDMIKTIGLFNSKAKNVIALAAGIIDGLQAGINAKSALLARGLAEIARLGTAMGARVDTFFGVAGVAFERVAYDRLMEA